MQNKFAGKCSECGNRVPAGEGQVDKVDGKWVVSHEGGCEQEPWNPLGKPGDSWTIHGTTLTLQADGKSTVMTASRMIGENDAEFDARSQVDPRLHTAATAAAADRMQIGARDYHIPNTPVDIDVYGALTDHGAEHLSRLIQHDKARKETDSVRP